MLESAKEDNENGYSAAALYEALEALSKANLALELVDADSIEKILSKIQRANESASASISESRLLGIEPILAVSYYEYAESLIESNANTALFYYKYSDLITGVITVASGYSSNHSSRYIGIPDISTSFILFSRNNYQYYALIFGFLGIIIGVSIGLLFGMLYYKKEPKKVNQNEIINKPYYVKTEKKNNELIKDEKIDDFPENINDFFKK
jgi:predicted S18 family serine protease